MPCDQKRDSPAQEPIALLALGQGRGEILDHGPGSLGGRPGLGGAALRGKQSGAGRMSAPEVGALMTRKRTARRIVQCALSVDRVPQGQQRHPAHYQERRDRPAARRGREEVVGEGQRFGRLPLGQPHLGPRPGQPSLLERALPPIGAALRCLCRIEDCLRSGRIALLHVGERQVRSGEGGPPRRAKVARERERLSQVRAGRAGREEQDVHLAEVAPRTGQPLSMVDRGGQVERPAQVVERLAERAEAS